MVDALDGIIFGLHNVEEELGAGTINELGIFSSRLDKTSEELLRVDTELGWTMDELLGDSVDVVLHSIAHSKYGSTLEMRQLTQKRWLALN